MTSLNISLPEALRRFVDQQVASGGYGTASEYVRELLRRAQKEHEEQERLESLLLEALKSPAREMTPEEWDDIRREALERLAVRKSR
jgi:antitoxin ParD1/3/4